MCVLSVEQIEKRNKLQGEILNEINRIDLVLNNISVDKAWSGSSALHDLPIDISHECDKLLVQVMLDYLPKARASLVEKLQSHETL